MRSSVAITLIVCGTLFALLPTASDYLQGYQVSQFLADRTIRSGITRIHQPFGETFRAAAWVLGGTMIGLGAVGSLAAGRPRHDMLNDDDWRQYERVQTN